MFAMFPDDDTAEAWFINRRWPDGVRCPQGCRVDDTRAPLSPAARARLLAAPSNRADAQCVGVGGHRAARMGR